MQVSEMLVCGIDLAVAVDGVFDIHQGDFDFRVFCVWNIACRVVVAWFFRHF